MYTIKINFENGKEAVLLKTIKAGQSLLEACLNNGIELGHECGGICSCTTCHLYILKGTDFLEQMSKREQNVLQKKNKGTEASRLGCQCLLVDGSGDVEIIIPVQAIGKSENLAE